MPGISVVIPTWNNADLTVKCLRALRDHTRADLHIAWIDNGSSQAQHDQVQAEIAGFDHAFEYHPEPLGFARAVNRGLPHLRGDYCVILNNDVEVKPGWDTELRAAVDDRPGIAGPICVNSLGWQDSRDHDWLNIPEGLEGDDAIAAWLHENWAGTFINLADRKDVTGFRTMLAFFCVLMPMPVLGAIGDLDENFGWGYFEDDDFCIRARRLGYTISLCPGATVAHVVSQTLRFLDDDHKERQLVNFRYLRKKHGDDIR
jgi:GT2 family glycosyltransferase